MSVRGRHEFTIAKLEDSYSYKGLSPAVSLVSLNLQPFISDTQSNLPSERSPQTFLRLWNEIKMAIYAYLNDKGTI